MIFYGFHKSELLARLVTSLTSHPRLGFQFNNLGLRVNRFLDSSYLGLDIENQDRVLVLKQRV